MMSFHTPTARTLRYLQSHLRRPQCVTSKSQALPGRCRNLATRRQAPPHNVQNPIDPIALHRLEAQRRAYYVRRLYKLGAGAVLGMIAVWITAMQIPLDAPTKPTKLDSSRRPDGPIVSLGRDRKVVVEKLGEVPEKSTDVVDTGTTTVPTFPRLLGFRDDDRDVDNGARPATNEGDLVEYQLLGLGIRTVSFLAIQVYVVGIYVASDDIATLQQAFIRMIDPIASTLVAGEKERLKDLLYDPVKGEEIWNSILKESGCRTLVRIVPTRNTDFHHLRDGWVRAITARAQANKEEFGDDSFGASMNNFKALFNRGSVPKQKELLLSRDGHGKLVVWYDGGKAGTQRLGQVEDERISRAVWLNYLAGKTVASEGARKSIVNGVVEFVERPIGTVAAQVHV